MKEFIALLQITNTKTSELERGIPIVHPVLNLHEKEDGTVIFLTERDNNLVDEGNCDIFAINVILKKNHASFL